MLTKLLTVSAFTLALTTGAMAQTSDSGTSSDSSGNGTTQTDSATTGSTNTGAAGTPGTAGTKDDDRCSETSAEQTTSVPSGTVPEAACED
ncbi:hypothetical protein RHAB21_01883 [Pseudorhizobium halotolerans]|uniref:Oxidoreductase n=1 Tax=Pseudorhizobium halotolerans TaxID=1233081 RepID=A0ABM8PI75_9HYPH|nr:hypothetical protein [Pseudorhizobium halotolerans]CAD7031562.1 hypothetical protein RHAB21_01883 [Pseudorhizobium halotolerans]